MFAKMRKGEKVGFRSYEPLREAIESYLISSVKSLARVVTKSKTRDEEQKEKYNDMVTTLIRDHGYSAESAEEILVYASNNLWRDS
jgi:serine protein kinase